MIFPGSPDYRQDDFYQVSRLPSLGKETGKIEHRVMFSCLLARAIVCLNEVTFDFVKYRLRV